MQMICLRDLSFLDAESLTPREGREALFRDEHGFVLYLSNDCSFAPNEERVIRFSAREALIWVNESALDQGSFWA